MHMSMTDPGQIYNYLGTNVTGTHASQRKRCLTRVENSAYGIKTDLAGPVISLVTENHRIFPTTTKLPTSLNTTITKRLQWMSLLNFLMRRS